jgi:DNA-binding transcriptional ArsR family regulator
MKLDSIFEALSNKNRRDIIYSVGLQPYSLSQLSKMQNLSFPALYKHIKILEKSKMIFVKKDGRTRYVTLNRKSLLLLQDWLSKYNAYWGSNKETLKNYKKFLKSKS